MSIFEVEQLLEPISPDLPCGENLEYDADFSELERLAQPVPTQQYGDTEIEGREPDWKDVRSHALELLARTKDLRVIMLLARATIRLDGLAGFRDVVAITRRLVEQYWKEVHPQLDPDDDLDPAMRVNALSCLGDNSACLLAIQDAPLIESPGLGNFGMREYLVAAGETPPRAGQDPVEMSTIESAFLDADGEGLLEKGALVSGTLEDLQAIETAITQEVGVQNTVNLDPVTDLFKKMSRLLSEQIERRGLNAPQEEAEVEEVSGSFDLDEILAADEAGSGAGSDGSSRGRTVSDEVSSREDVVRLLDKACEYYQKYEPSSPVPLLLRRAKRLVTMGFMELLRELVPSGVSEAELLGGPSGAESEEGS